MTINSATSLAPHLPVSTADGPVSVLVDEVTVERLNGRRLSMGSHGYPQLWHNGQMTLLHRWAVGVEVGEKVIVDHINGDRLDCRLTNLRIGDARMNAANRRCTAASGYRGVSRAGDRWTAQGKVRGKSFYLGSFSSPEEAAEVAHIWRLANLDGYLGDARSRYNPAATDAA